MVYGLGFGARSTLLSLVTSWINPQRTGTLYSAVFLVEQIGMLGGEPLIQNLLGVSIGFQDPWKGLPFLSIGVSFILPLKQKSVCSNYQYAAVLFNKPYLRLRNSVLLVKSKAGIVPRPKIFRGKDPRAYCQKERGFGHKRFWLSTARTYVKAMAQNCQLRRAWNLPELWICNHFWRSLSVVVVAGPALAPLGGQGSGKSFPPAHTHLFSAPKTSKTIDNSNGAVLAHQTI